MTRTRLWGYIIAAVVVAAVLTAGAFITFGGNKSPEATPTTPTTASSGSTVSNTPSPAPNADGCITTPNASGGPLTAAPATEWYLIKETGQPAPKTAGGPFKMDDGLGLCYTPDTLGALTAAANIVLRTFDSQMAAKAAEKQSATPPTKEELDRIRRTDYGYTRPFPTLTAFAAPQTISNNEVTIYLQVTGTAKGSPFTTWASLRLRWMGNDWGLVTSDVVQSTATSTQWSA